MSIVFGRACSSPCASPCCSPPTISSVQCRTRSASKTKCGFHGFSGGTPAHVYLTMTQSGTIASAGVCKSSNVTNTWAGSATYDRSTCTISSDTRSLEITDDYFIPTCDTTLTDPVPSCADALSSTSGSAGVNLNYMGVGISTCPANCSAVLGYCSFGGTTVVSDSQLDTNVTASGFSGSASVVLSNEYLTADLKTDTASALSAAGWSSYGTCSFPYTVFDLTTDELTCTEREVDVKVSFAAIPAGSSMCLKYDVNVWFDGSPLVIANCVNLTAGQTEYVINLPAGGAATYNIRREVANVRIECGTC